MKIILPLLLIVTLLITFHSGCTKEKINIPDIPLNSRLEQFVNNGLILKLGSSRSEIFNNLGNPKSTKIEKVKNIHDPELTDEIHNLFYDGLRLKLFYSPHYKNEFIFVITVSSNKYKILWDLTVGSSKNKVRTILGAPHSEDNNVYHYIYESPESGFQDNVYFYFSNDVVESIEWSYYVD